MKDVLAFVMAGGRGERLMPLTEDRTKPAVPFGGIYRLIDLPLSNCINSQIYKIIVLPQYKSQSLHDHLEDGWNIFSQELSHFLKIVHPQQRIQKLLSIQMHIAFTEFSFIAECGYPPNCYYCLVANCFPKC